MADESLRIASENESLRVATENLTRVSAFVQHCEEKYKRWDNLVEENFTNPEALNKARTERDKAYVHLEKAREELEKAHVRLDKARADLDKLLNPQAPSQNQPAPLLPFSDGVDPQAMNFDRQAVLDAPVDYWDRGEKQISTAEFPCSFWQNIVVQLVSADMTQVPQ